MGRHEPETTAEELLAHGGWLRALALRLVGDADVAEDLVQETWIAAARRTPEARESLRPWLAKVLRDAFRMRARSEGRRSAREQAAALVGTAEPDEVPTPESLVVRAEAQRRLVDLVLRLDEPYRSTVLLHYSEGVSLADIARSQGVPAGTVRWRMKAAIDQLRAWLDETGDRRQWVVTLLALPKGALVAQKTSKVAIAIVLLLLLVGGAAVFLIVRGKDDTRARNAAGHRQAASPPAASSDDPAGGAELPAGNVITAGTPPLEWFGQRGVKPRRVAGRVLTLDGKPVAGAAVELGSLSTMGGLGVAPIVQTAADGTFDFGTRVAAAYHVTASAPGSTGATKSIDLRDPTVAPPPDQLELRLGPCDQAVFGTVRDASGGPVEGARVQWLSTGASGDGSDPSRSRGASALSSATGAYELCVTGGREPVVTEVTADGYGAIVYQTQVWGRRKLDFALVPEAIVVGRVIREDTRAPVAHAAVGLVSGQWGLERTAARGAVTGADGTFRITNVAPGPHFLDAIAAGLATARETPIVVEAGQTSEPVELVLETRSVVRGTVVLDGKPVAGATVTARVGDTRRPSADAVSQADGTFVLDRVPRGTVRFYARPYEVDKPVTFAVTKPEHDGVVLSVKPLGAIVGTVVRSGKPVAGALIELQGVSAQELGPIVSDGDGRFAARGLRPGRWVAFASSDRLGTFGRAKEDIELAAGETAEVTIDMPYGAAISGKVVDQDGAPVPNVSVAFRHTSVDDVGLATTAADGSYRATMMIGGGTYRPLISLGVRTATLLRPAQGDQFPVFTLPDGASELSGVVLAVRVDHLSISGRVVDETGAPVSDAHVAAERVEPGAEPRFWRWYQQTATITDVEGRFTIDELSSGPHAVQVRTAAGLETIVRDIAAGRRDVTVVLPSAGSIQGTLAGFDGPVRVIAVRAEARGAEAPLRGTVTGATFSVPSLGPGPYLVSAFTDTEVASAPVTVVAGKAAQVALTGGGTGSVIGTVRDFETGRPVEGMHCSVFARAGDVRTSASIGTGAQSDRNGVFELPAVAAGDVAITCWPSGAVYTQGLRLVTIAPGDRLQLDVPVVAIRQDPTQVISGFGADFDPPSLVPRLFRVSPRGPAGMAGLADGDVITHIDNRSVAELHHQGAWFFLIYHPPGSTVPITARRGARSFTVNLVMGPTDN